MTQRNRARHVDAPLAFGARLRHERERRKITIASIAENTKILGALLEGLENDDVSRWPTGFYRRAFIRAYAAAIGLDPEPVVREFGELFPDPDAAASLPAPLPPTAAVSQERDRKLPAIRMTAPDAATWFSPGSLVREARLRCFAVAVDAFVISVMGLALFAVFGSFWAPLTLATGAYYFGSILIFGNTPGVCLFAGRRAIDAGEDAESKAGSPIGFALAKILRRAHWREADASNLG